MPPARSAKSNHHGPVARQQPRALAEAVLIARCSAPRVRTADLPLALWPCAQRTSQWQRHGRYVPESNRHPAKMLPEIARRVDRPYSSPGDLVLDPMCGIATTLVEAIHLERRAIGVELEGTLGVARREEHRARPQSRREREGAGSQGRRSPSRARCTGRARRAGAADPHLPALRRTRRSATRAAVRGWPAHPRVRRTAG